MDSAAKERTINRMIGLIMFGFLTVLLYLGVLPVNPDDPALIVYISPILLILGIDIKTLFNERKGSSNGTD